MSNNNIVEYLNILQRENEVLKQIDGDQMMKIVKKKLTIFFLGIIKNHRKFGIQIKKFFQISI